MRILTKATVFSIGGAVACYCISPNLRDVITEQFSSFIRSTSTPTSAEPDGKMTLKNVQVLFRHGARTPLKHIPGLEEVLYDPHVLLSVMPHMEVPITVEFLHGGPRPQSSLQSHYNETTFKGGISAGVLTNVGREQAYSLGQRLAARYRDQLHFIGNDYTNIDVYLRSTNVDRCIQSLQCCIAGLFTASSFKPNDPALIRVENIEHEILFPNPRRCQTFKSLLKQSRASYETTSEYIELVKRVQGHTGDSAPIEEFDMMQLRDHVVAREAHGLPVPRYLHDLRAEVDKAAVDVLLHYVCGHIRELCLPCEPTNETSETSAVRDCTQAARTLGLALAMGRTWHLVTETMQNAAAAKISGPRPPKLLLYCCHDSSLAPLLLAMGCYDNEWPPYCADIAFELYEDSKGQHWVNVTYCGKDMVLEGSSKPVVPLERFLELVKPYIISPDQFDTYCTDSTVASKLLGGCIPALKDKDKDTPLPNVV